MRLGVTPIGWRLNVTCAPGGDDVTNSVPRGRCSFSRTDVTPRASAVTSSVTT